MARTNTWKAHERRMAKRLGGKRNGNRGTAAADVETGWASIECKHRKQLPAWLHDAMRQAQAAAQPGQLPVVILHQLHQRSDNDFVVIRFSDFKDWFGVFEPEGFDEWLEAGSGGDCDDVSDVPVLRVGDRSAD